MHFNPYIHFKTVSCPTIYNRRMRNTNSADGIYDEQRAEAATRRTRRFRHNGATQTIADIVR